VWQRRFQRRPQAKKKSEPAPAVAAPPQSTEDRQPLGSRKETKLPEKKNTLTDEKPSQAKAPSKQQNQKKKKGPSALSVAARQQRVPSEAAGVNASLGVATEAVISENLKQALWECLRAEQKDSFWVESQELKH
jgi:cytoskeletal protein RodZ